MNNVSANSVYFFSVWGIKLYRRLRDNGKPWIKTESPTLELELELGLGERWGRWNEHWGEMGVGLVLGRFWVGESWSSPGIRFGES